MLRKKRNLVIDLFDFKGNKLCSLYDSSSDVSGQAYDVFISESRNGWRELSFNLPSVIEDENGECDNYRLNYLKADYRIRIIDDNGVDWFIVSEPRITHSNFTKQVNVVAGHISQILKVKNFGLEFSDDEGNNIGTADQLLATILDGTGWTPGLVDTFYEKDGVSIKVRSLKAPAKTGAFGLIASMCNLFDAKPIYHGDSKTVDIVPLNPFSDPNGGVPNVANDKVIELHYGQNLRNISRTLNAENITTKLYAYGSYGDDVSGYCGIDECLHNEYIISVDEDILYGTECKVIINDPYGVSTALYFTVMYDVYAGSTLVWSDLDPCSKMYVWDNVNEAAYLIKDKPNTSEYVTLDSIERQEKQNKFSFVMDFDYYAKEDMLTDSMLQSIAAYQRNAPQLIEESEEAARLYAESYGTLSELIGVVDYCKLDVLRYTSSGSYVAIELDKSTHADGVIYRTDYDKKKDKQFKWRIATEIKENGDPKEDVASMVLIIHNTNPVTWDKAYLKEIDNEDDPSKLVLWTPYDSFISGSDDKVYLFHTNNINGYLGAYESADESTVSSLASATKIVTEDHPVVFCKELPAISDVVLNGYGWAWKYGNIASDSKLYFCWEANGDTSWNIVHITDTAPSTISGYWYNWKTAVLYRASGGWYKFESQSEKRIASLFSTVIYSGMQRDRYYIGQNDYYTYDVNGALPAGNYTYPSEYGVYWLFTTKNDLSSGDTLVYDTSNKWITQTKDGIDTTVESKSYRFDSLNYHPDNVLSNIKVSSGKINDEGIVIDGSGHVTNFARVYENIDYDILDNSSSLDIYFYNEKNLFIDKTTAISSFHTPINTRYIRIYSSSDISGLIIHAHNYQSMVIADNVSYTIIDPISKSGNIKGIIDFMRRFAEVSDDTFELYLQNMLDAQAALKEYDSAMNTELGDILREGWWQKGDYVDGDEIKLYDDAVDNLVKISKPEATYNIGFLDRYEEIDDAYYFVDDVTGSHSWPDIDTSFAVHVVDPDIDVNVWAFIDSIKKCYDKPWETSISVNTNLSTINQHTFTDVMSHIADVANEINAKQTKYDKAIVPTDSGKVSTDVLQGSVDANTLSITGGSSNWYTDRNGNIIFESADGDSAMMLTGSGFAIANSKNRFGDWVWRTFGTGNGFTADEIVTGFLRASAVTILGSEMFYWNGDNIYIYDPDNKDRQIRIGLYDGVNYGIGYTQDNGATWQSAVSFDGIHFEFGHISDIEGLQEALDSKASASELESISVSLSADIDGITQRLDAVDIEGLEERVTHVEQTVSEEGIKNIVKTVTYTKDEADEQFSSKSEVESELDILSDEIALKASTETTDALGNRLTSAEAQLTVQSGQISSKVSQSDYDTAMEQTAQAISAKADSTTVDALSGSVSDLSTTVSTTSSGLSALTTRVTEAEGRLENAETSIEAVPGEINLAVSGIVIGARNYLLNTNRFSEWYVDPDGGYTDNNFNYNEMYLNTGLLSPIASYPKMNYPSMKGQNIIFSFEYQATNTSFIRAGETFDYSICISNSIQRDNVFTAKKTYSIDKNTAKSYWNVVEVNVGLSDSLFDIGTVIGNEQYLFVSFNNGTSSEIKIRNVKFEIGTKRTDWSLAPEDDVIGLDTGEDNVQVKITKDTFDVNVNGGDSEMVINESGAVFGNVTITREINAPSLLKIFEAGDYSIGLPPSTDTRTYTKIYSSLSDFADDIRYKTVNGLVNVYVNKDINEKDVTIIGVGGLGICIDGLDHEWYGNIIVSSCSCGEIKIQNFVMHSTIEDEVLVYLAGCQFVTLDHMKYNGHHKAKDMIYVAQSTSASIVENEFYEEAGNTCIGIHAMYASRVYVLNQKGGVHTFFQGAGCVVCWSGTRALGSLVEEAPYLSVPIDISTVQTDPGEGGGGGGDEPTTVIFAAEYTRNCRGTGTWDSASYAQTGITQNYYNNNYYKGCIWFNIPNGQFTGKTIKSVSLRLHRPSSGYGTTSAIAVKLIGLSFTYAENLAQAKVLPNSTTGSSYVSNYYIDGTYNTFLEIGTINRNEQKDFELPLTDGFVNNLLLNHGLCLFGGETTAASGHNYSNNYGIYSGAAPTIGPEYAPQLIITYV